MGNWKIENGGYILEELYHRKKGALLTFRRISINKKFEDAHNNTACLNYPNITN